MNNVYHTDIYQFNKPVSSYWEATSSENLNLDKLQKDISSEIVVIGGGYTGLLCAINLIENYSIAELVDNCLAKNTKKTLTILNENNFSSCGSKTDKVARMKLERGRRSPSQVHHIRIFTNQERFVW